MIKQISYNKHFPSTGMPAILVIGILLPAYDVSLIFIGFMFSFHFCDMTSVKCLRFYPFQVSIGQFDLVVSSLLSPVSLLLHSVFVALVLTS